MHNEECHVKAEEKGRGAVIESNVIVFSRKQYKTCRRAM